MPRRDPYRALAAGLRETRRKRQRAESFPIFLTSEDWDLVIDALDRAAKPYARPQAGAARMRALRMIGRRDWPAGEPRLRLLHAGTAQALLRDGLIVCRPNSATDVQPSPIVDLTDTARTALESDKGGAP